MNLNQAIQRAKARVIETGKTNRHAFVCHDYDGGFEIIGNAEYQETSEESRCAASVWSYEDDNGKLVAAVETY